MSTPHNLRGFHVDSKTCQHVSQHLLWSETLFLRIPSWLPPSEFWHLFWNNTSLQSTTVFAWISPKAEPETKVWMHVVLGGNWSQGKESRRKERKLNQGYLSDLIELSLASSLCGSWRMCSRIIYSDEEEASMYLPLPSPFSQRLLKGILLPLTKWVHAFTRIHACGLSCFSHVWFFVTAWAVAHQVLQARILKWVVMLSFKGSSQPWDQTHVSYFSCIGRWFFTTSTTWGSPFTRVVKKNKLSGAQKPL